MLCRQQICKPCNSVQAPGPPVALLAGFSSIWNNWTPVIPKKGWSLPHKRRDKQTQQPPIHSKHIQSLIFIYAICVLSSWVPFSLLESSWGGGWAGIELRIIKNLLLSARLSKCHKIYTYFWSTKLCPRKMHKTTIKQHIFLNNCPYTPLSLYIANITPFSTHLQISLLHKPTQLS